MLLATVLVVSLCPGFRALAAPSGASGARMQAFSDDAISDIMAAGEGDDAAQPESGELPDDGVIDFGDEGLDVEDLEAEGAESADADEENPLVAGDPADPANSASSAAVDPNAEAKTLTYENDTLIATVEAPKGTLPDGAYLEVEEIRPVTYEKAEAYAEALTSLSEKLRVEDRSYTEAKVYDIRIMRNGREIEPNGQVKVKLDYKQQLKLKDAEPQAANVEVAHVADVPGVQQPAAEKVDATLDATRAGAVKSAEFKAESFSYYIVFGTQEGSASEPVTFGDYGWLKFATPTSSSDWGHYQTDAELPATNTEDGYHRILKVNLHTLKESDGVSTYDESSYDDSNYNLVSTNQYFWTWENNVYISDFNVPGYEVVQTKMHTAWADASDDVQQDSLVGNYAVRGYRSSDGTSSDLNVLDVYMKSVDTPDDAMRYIVRYVHADGSVTDGNVRYLSGGSVVLNVNRPRDGEVFSGIAVAAGAEAVTADSSAKTVTFTYDPKVNLAKAYVYFEPAPVANTSSTKGRYDKDSNGKYYNGEKGLYTDKSAQVVEGKDREFLVNLEAWYVDNAASVGMILDASGSMAWTAGVPTAMEFTQAELNDLGLVSNDGQGWSSSSSSNPLDAASVNKLLEVSECDNSNNGYNGYKYYVYTRTVQTSNPINEYAALGYTYSNVTTSGSNEGTIRLGSPEKGTAKIKHAKGPGWYFVNSGTTAADYESFGAKRYEGVADNNSGPCRFYIKAENGKYYLYCTFSQGSTADSDHPGTTVQESKVYEKRDQMLTKSETLQDSIAQFGAILNGASPESQMSAVRFSHANFQRNLVLLNWTSESEKMAAAMNLSPNTAGGTARSDGTYQYGITGGTKARFGFNEYNSQLKGSAKAENYKYLVLFTDGKDQGTSDTEKTTRTWLETTFPGYTIITMFMRSVGMTDGDVSQSRTFLQGLASGGKNGDPSQKLYYEATSDSAHDVVDQFRQIAEHIVTGLHNYSVRDYIDPRFDVINDAGQVLSVLDENGQFTSSTNSDVDDNGFRGFTTPDGKQAMLGYDSQRKMFYVLWQHQEIQASAVGSGTQESTVFPWKSQIRLQAKEDFIGGNDVLTNGNAPDDNLVYKPSTSAATDSQGRLIPKYDDYGREIVDESQTKKSFPFASVNPGLLDVALGNYEDTVYLGEEITPGELLSVMMGTDDGPAKARVDARHRVADTVYNKTEMKATGDDDLSSRWYVEYLERLGVKLHNNEDYYGTILQHVTLAGDAGVEALVTQLTNTSLYTFSDSGGVVTAVGKDDTAVAGEKITIDKSSAEIKLELPYYYLESPTDPTSYAGLDTEGVVEPQDDKVGTLTYTWKLHEFAGNTPVNDTKGEANKFVKFDTYVDQTKHMDTTKPVKYQFSISYEPLALSNDAKSDGSGHTDNQGDGSERTRALTGKTGNGTDRVASLIRNVDEASQRQAVAGKQNTTDEMGWAVVHAVDGRLLVEKRMLTTDFNKANAKNVTGSMTFTLTGANITSEPANEVVWTKELNFDTSKTYETDGDYTILYTEWVTGLPQGTYTLAEETTGGITLDEIVGSDDVKFHPYPDTPSADPAQPYNETAASFAVTHNAPTWTFGSNPTKTHTDYPASDYAYATVTDSSGAYKGTDAYANSEAGGWAKDYLNAQIGRAIVKNKLVTTSIDVTKTWLGDVPDAPIVVKLTDGGNPAQEFYVELNAGNNWSATVEKIDPDDAEYTAQEGTGTVAADGTCSNFAPFDERFTHDEKQYKRVSVVYKDKDGNTRSENNVVAHDAPKAGSVAFTNQEITRVTVQKVWDGVTPAQQADKPFTVRLTGSDGNEYYAQLGPDDWTYTFKDLPAKTGLTYTADEGTATWTDGTSGTWVDGTCSGFAAFPARGTTFTFDGKTYQRVKAEYFDAGSQAPRTGDGAANLDGSATPDAGKAVFTNEALTEVEVQKVWADGVAAADQQQVYVQLYKGAEPQGDPVALSSSGGLTHTWSMLKVVEGVTYTVKEGKLEGGAFVPYGTVFELDNGKKMRQSTEYKANANGTKPATEGAEALLGSVSPYGGKATITNDYVLAEIKILKVQASNTDVPIDGVTFTLLQDADTPATGNPTYDQANDVTPVDDAERVTTADGGKLDLPKLAPGAYWLLETDVPAGYVLPDPDHPIGIVISDEGAVRLVPDSTFQGNMVPQLSGPTDGVYTLQVPNMLVYNLPGTGGPGALPFLFVGAFLAALAVGGRMSPRRPFASAPTSARGTHGAHGATERR